jgi:NTP pyrophosphatase (non-canonical NTP hydrolase)
MDNKEYVEGVLKTEPKNYSPVMERLGEVGTVRLLHSMIGLCTESGEIQDQIKKHVFYGKPLDKTNLIEELGDLFWYVGIMANELGVSFEEIMAKNNAKLRARYGEKFTEQAALVRNLDNERKILEGK